MFPHQQGVVAQVQGRTVGMLRLTLELTLQHLKAAMVVMVFNGLSPVFITVVAAAGGGRTDLLETITVVLD
jgi:hypothetical protein